MTILYNIKILNYYTCIIYFYILCKRYLVHKNEQYTTGNTVLGPMSHNALPSI